MRLVAVKFEGNKLSWRKWIPEPIMLLYQYRLEDRDEPEARSIITDFLVASNERVVEDWEWI